MSVSLDPSNGSACRDKPRKRSIAAGHHDIPPNATVQIHVQKHVLGPQTRALVPSFKIPRVVSSFSPMKSGTAFGAFAGQFRTPTAAATLHDPSGAEPSRSAARFTIVFFGLPVSVAPRQP